MIYKSKICPHCDQKIMVYRRNIRIGMAIALKKLYILNRTTRRANPVSDIPDLSRGVFADFTKLKYWGLIKEVGNNHWEVTREGREFIFGRLPVRKYKWIYNNEIMPDDPQVKNPIIFIYNIDPITIDKASTSYFAGLWEKQISENQMQLL